MQLAVLGDMRPLLFSIVTLALTACGREAKPPQHVGTPLGSTHVSRGPDDPTVPNPDGGIAEPGPGMRITAPAGPAPTPPAPSNQSNQPATPPAQTPGVFAPPPSPEGVPGTPVSEPTPIQPTPTPRDTQ